MILVIFFVPSVKIGKHTLQLYWVVALMGALIMLCAQILPIADVWAGLTKDGTMNPIKILVFFISMTIISIFLDEIGLFRYLASLAVTKAKGSQFWLFAMLYALVSILKMFTSNDIIVLTVTPFICYFARRAHINPIPYLIGEFTAANTWSMMMLIGNPTNIYLGTSAHIGFFDYLSVMWLPTLLAGTVEFLILCLLFRRSFKAPLFVDIGQAGITSKVLLWIGVAVLVGCTALVALSDYISLPMYLIALVSAVGLLLVGFVYRLARKERPAESLVSLKRAPWELVPFVLSMFVLVLALESQGITENIASFLGNSFPILKYGVSSFLACNLINNIPMSVLFSAVTSTSALTGKALYGAVYASIIGSNIGAFFTPIGALAGIMWIGILKKQDVAFSFGSFVKYGLVIALPTLAAALLGLYLVLLV